MFLLYHSDRCNTSEAVFHWCYINDLHTTHAVVCWVTSAGHFAEHLVGARHFVKQGAGGVRGGAGEHVRDAAQVR
jgi:hypothetical protein